MEINYELFLTIEIFTVYSGLSCYLQISLNMAENVKITENLKIPNCEIFWVLCIRWRGEASLVVIKVHEAVT